MIWLLSLMEEVREKMDTEKFLMFHFGETGKRAVVLRRNIEGRTGLLE